MHTETGMEGSCCGALTGRVPGGQVTDHVLWVAGWALLLWLIWRGREGCHFSRANPTVLFPFLECHR